MKEHRFSLEPYNGMQSRYKCPNCQAREKTFSRYIDNETSEYLNSSVGRCNRENKCGYHYTPKQYFLNNKHSEKHSTFTHVKPQKIIQEPRTFSTVPEVFFKDSLKSYESNNFVSFLLKHFGVDKTNELISKYFIGTSKHWNGATVFWQIDINGKIRTGKIMLYNPIDCKRVKEPFNHISWAHKVLNNHEFKLSQCLFGEHLLHEKSKPVAIVESEKTAIIASVFLPQYIWLATGGLMNLNSKKCNIFRGRSISLFPDIGCYDIWLAKAETIFLNSSFSISNFLEVNALTLEKLSVEDLADILIALTSQ